ncbi:hypothetical protein [Streptomyces sp. NRRL S-920]|uniref:hypothetical protein n=1 Tax=Streptomyces sp. NRRL S-920 TaxID=1463921 RepID=UPI0004C9CA45|nr:hypothetical protein [Streptomyces sp. NRRL S-920]
MTTPNPFAQPDKGDRFTPRDHPEWLGKLFIIYPDSVNQHQGTDDKGQPQMYEAVEADVAIVDLPNPETGQPTTLTNARIAGKGLVPQIRKHCGGGMVLGRLSQSPPNGRNSGAYFLAEYTDADVQLATQYINAHPRNAFTQPTAQQAPAPAPAQQQAWGQQPQNVPGYGGPQAQPQYASQQLPYDPWQGTPGAAAPQPQAAPAGPPPGQWQPPAASPQAAPAQTAPASASAALDPALVAFLQSKGVNPEGMTPEQATMIANTLQTQERPPF